MDKPYCEYSAHRELTNSVTKYDRNVIRLESVEVELPRGGLYFSPDGLRVGWTLQ